MKTIKLFILFCALACMACQSNENEMGSLKGTKWKLAGFIDAVTDEMKEAEPVSEKCYLLTFNKDNTLSGVSSTNQLTGIYKLEEKTSSIYINIWPMTLINELFDGELYCKDLNAVKSFSLQKNELRLYYNDDKNYLLFKLQ
ncbi:MAG: META domain-containing protein [Candidatus Azobacteroides sp.]|nr:META domain-containing protein [Candidatus Azobacteroides sp.]